MQDEFERIIFHALQDRVTDIHIILKEDCSIYYRKVGKLIKYTMYHYEEGHKLINYIRFLSKVDMNYQWKPQTGSYVLENRKQRYYLRVSSLPGNKVDSLVIRILNNHTTLDIHSISYFSDTRAFLLEVTKKKQGLFIVSGATGSGKSTTLYTLLDTIHELEQKNIITLEDPIEVEKEYCLQMQMNENQGITYQDTLKQVLRHDPDIIMVGEIRDSETAKLAVNCALTGHLVLTSLHAGDCITTIQRLLHLDISKLDLQEILIGIVNQTMIYKTKLNKPIVLSEFMNKEQIHSYFMSGSTMYTTYGNHAKQLVKDDVVQYEEVSEYLYE
jgi:type II secretory ATPase GspE/PulE/Tfp pilus assembly ATPase PilB-like protein